MIAVGVCAVIEAEYVSSLDETVGRICFAADPATTSLIDLAKT